MKKHKYEVAFSFAGEDRVVVEKIAKALHSQKVEVFYDNFEKKDLWGKDLYEHLADVYSQQAQYCVMFLSQHYAKKLWTNHERQNAQARAFRENKEYILPVRLDDTAIPGIRGTVGYIDLRHTPVGELVDLILQKLGRNPSPKPKSPTKKPRTVRPPKPSVALPEIKRSFTQLDKDRYLKTSFATIRKYFREGLGQLKKKNKGVDTDFTPVTALEFSCKIYVNGSVKSQCKIWMGGSFVDGIYYSADSRGHNSWNDMLTVQDGGSSLFLRPTGSFMSSSQDGQLTPEKAAAYLWERLTAQLKY